VEVPAGGAAQAVRVAPAVRVAREAGTDPAAPEEWEVSEEPEASGVQEERAAAAAVGRWAGAAR